MAQLRLAASLLTAPLLLLLGRLLLLLQRRAAAAAALRGAGLLVAPWRPRTGGKLYRRSQRSLLEAVRAKATGPEAAGRNAFGASSLRAFNAAWGLTPAR